MAAPSNSPAGLFEPAAGVPASGRLVAGLLGVVLPAGVEPLDGEVPGEEVSDDEGAALLAGSGGMGRTGDDDWPEDGIEPDDVPPDAVGPKGEAPEDPVGVGADDDDPPPPVEPRTPAPVTVDAQPVTTTAHKAAAATIRPLMADYFLSYRTRLRRVAPPWDG